MAQATRMLLQNLIKAHDISNAKGNRTRVEDNLLPLLSNARSGRTNQFEVNDRLDGLVEKCRILNNDPLGDALQARLEELPVVSNKWTPDILALLLGLSNRPVHETRVKDLATLRPETASAPLTWEEIIEEDPVEDETAIWRDVDFAANSSDEDLDVGRRPARNRSDEDLTQASSTEDLTPDIEALIVPVNKIALQALSDIENGQAEARSRAENEVHESQKSFEILETVAIQDIIFLLLGLPTSTFDEDSNGNYRPKRGVRLCNVSCESFEDILGNFLDLGQKLSRLRKWIKMETDVSWEQTFRSAVEARLKIFHSSLHGLQTRILDNSNAFVGSLLAVSNEVQNSSRLIVRLYNIILALMAVDRARRPFDLLQYLYDQVCMSQKDCDDEGYESMARIFFQCFQIYLKPVLSWMESGKTSRHSQFTFIEKLDKKFSLNSLWQDQHRLVYNTEGALKAPRFLHVAAKKIFNTGKSVDFLEKLALDRPAKNPEPNIEPHVTYESVCLSADTRNLSPFSDLFDTALSALIASKHQSSSSYLRYQLESRCGLRRALSALEYIYFYRDGALSSRVVCPLFERIERVKKPWNDTLTATKLFHIAFASAKCIDLDCLSAQPTDAIHSVNTKQRSMNMIETLSVSYLLPWPVANIIRPQSISTYQRIFILLTQITRAKYLLQRSKLPAKASTTLYAVHTNLLWFVNSLLAHLTSLVIEVNTTQMRHQISKAEDVDDMIAVHGACIARLADQCFLTKRHTSLHQAIVSILDLAVLFSDVQDSFAENTATTHIPRKSHLESELSSSDDNDDNDDEVTRNAKPALHSRIPPAEKLAQIRDTHAQLLTIVTAAVESVSKANGGPIWETLAGNLAFASVR